MGVYEMSCNVYSKLDRYLSNNKKAVKRGTPGYRRPSCVELCHQGDLIFDFDKLY